MGMNYDFLYDEILREGISIDKDNLLDNIDLIRSTFGTSVKRHIVNKLSDRLSNTYDYSISPTTSDNIFLEIKYSGEDLILYDYKLTPVGNIYLTNNKIEATFAYDYNPDKVTTDLLGKDIQCQNNSGRVHILGINNVDDVYKVLYGNVRDRLPNRYDLYKNRNKDEYKNRIVCMRPLSFRYHSDDDNNVAPKSIKNIKGLYAIVLNNVPGWSTKDSRGKAAPNVCYVGSQSKGIDARIENFLSVDEADLKDKGSTSYKFMNVYLNKFLESNPSNAYATVYALPQAVHISRSSEVRVINWYFDDPNYVDSPYKLNVTKAR